MGAEMPQKHFLTGKRFDRLVVGERFPTEPPNFRARYRCRCDCGVEIAALQQGLLSGQTRSCGCGLPRKPEYHGHTRRLKEEGRDQFGRTPEYRVWRSMQDRCNNPNHNSFPRYGGRGIEICERWRSFSNFLEDMGSRPSSRHSIERDDNNLGYSKDNCHWALPTEQQRNTRATKFGSSSFGVVLKLQRTRIQIGLQG